VVGPLETLTAPPLGVLVVPLAPVLLLPPELVLEPPVAALPFEDDELPQPASPSAQTERRPAKYFMSGMLASRAFRLKSAERAAPGK
jgi:hypothetical protein